MKTFELLSIISKIFQEISNGIWERVNWKVKFSAPVTIEALKDEEGEVRWYAAWVLSKIGCEAKVAVSALIEALKDENGEVRILAAKTLWNMSDEVEIPVSVLLEALEDKEQYVRRFANKTLAKVTEQKVTAVRLGKSKSDFQPRSKDRLMLAPIKVVDIELSRPLVTIEDLGSYMGLQGLVRLYGTPIGYIKAPVTSGRCTAATLSELILKEHSQTIIKRLLQNGLASSPQPEGLRLEDLFDVPLPEYSGTFPLVTVAVCTRNRTADLALCLDALVRLDYPAVDILVIDNAPVSEATEHLVQSKYPNVRYVCEPRPGLDWARNRAIIEAYGEIIAYTDDDVVVDPGWVKALVKVFAENSEVMAVTGLVVPYELETESQVLFEMYGGFGRGMTRKWYRVGRGNKMPWRLLGTGQFGTGANMAYRRCVFDEIGYFDPALDVGTLTNGGGDLEMFFRVLKEGHTLVYEPSAIIRHRHRRDYANLRSQIANNGSLYSYFVRSALAYPDERLSFLWLGMWWMCYWNIRRLLISFIHPIRFPRDLILAELWGDFVGLTRYQKAYKNAVQIAKIFGSLTSVIVAKQTLSLFPVAVKGSTPPASPPPLLVNNTLERNLSISEATSKYQNAVAVRTVELTQPIQPLTDVTDYSGVQVFVTWNNSLLGSLEIANQHQSVSATRLLEAIVDNLGFKLLEPDRHLNTDYRWAEVKAIRGAIAALHATLNQHYTPTEDEAITAKLTKLPADISVSILVGTYNRPDELRNCLRCLVAQETPRQVEIIVVDNHPASGLTPPVVSEFPGVMLVSEPRQGVAYARNAGIIASRGDIVVTTDDDVTMPPDWLEKLIAPFSRADVMSVTGNVLPLELETSSQRLFERYGGLGRGFDVLEVNGEWFERFRYQAVPTWELGGTGNAAFRASIFNHPQISLMDEALGPGMPSGVGEDSYLFYKVLKAGYTLIYEPKAYVWHKHRRDMSALRRQIYNYSKGHVSHHLTTWVRDRDFRGLAQILVALPIYHYRRIKERLLGRSDYPLSLVLLEIAGNLAGPWSLWQSYRRVSKEGRSAPYIPVQQRVATPSPLSLPAAHRLKPRAIKTKSVYAD
jgi:GT2 family glycosyltransferase